MRKILIGVATLVFLLGAWVNKALAQNVALTYERAYNDYVYNLDQYQKAHSDYEIAKNGYLKNPTIAAQAETIGKTKTMLASRDEVVITYLVALKQKLNETVGISQNDRNNFGTQIDLEVSWYKSHKERLTSSGGLDDLTKDSNEASDRFDKFTQILAYKVLTVVSVGKIVDFRAQERDLVSQIEDVLEIIRADKTKDTALIERWLLEVNDRLDRSSAKETEGKNLVLNFDEKQKDKLKIFNDSQFKLSESLQYLKEANFYLSEIVKEIKYE